MPSDETVIVRELRDRGEAEIVSLLEAKYEDMHKTKFNHALGQQRETHRLRQLKRDIARLNTVLREKRAAPKPEASAP